MYLIFSLILIIQPLFASDKEISDLFNKTFHENLDPSSRYGDTAKFQCGDLGSFLVFQSVNKALPSHHIQSEPCLEKGSYKFYPGSELIKGQVPKVYWDEKKCVSKEEYLLLTETPAALFWKPNSVSIASYQDSYSIRQSSYNLFLTTNKDGKVVINTKTNSEDEEISYQNFKITQFTENGFKIKCGEKLIDCTITNDFLSEFDKTQLNPEIKIEYEIYKNKDEYIVIKKSKINSSAMVITEIFKGKKGKLEKVYNTVEEFNSREVETDKFNFKITPKYSDDGKKTNYSISLNDKTTSGFEVVEVNPEVLTQAFGLEEAKEFSRHQPENLVHPCAILNSTPLDLEPSQSEAQQ